jgi:hypothetical protein
MASVLTLSNATSTKTVTMTNSDPKITRALSNPVVVIPVPTDKTLKKPRQYVLDLTMVTESISIDCIFKDGFGTHDFVSGTTNYEKLMSIFSDGGTGLLVWGSGSAIQVKSTSLSFSFDAGKKDIVYCSMKLYTMKNLTQPK